MCWTANCQKKKAANKAKTSKVNQTNVEVGETIWKYDDNGNPIAKYVVTQVGSKGGDS